MTLPEIEERASALSTGFTTEVRRFLQSGRAAMLIGKIVEGALPASP